MKTAVAVHLPSFISNIFNPFAWLNNALSGLMKSEVGVFESAIINPPSQLHHQWTDYLYGNAIGLAGSLSAGITVILVLITVVRLRTAVSALQSLIVTILIGALYPMWFKFIAWLVDLGTALGHWVQFYHGTSGHSGLIVIPSINNDLGSIIGLGAIWGVGSIVVSLFFIYSVALVLVTFLGLPAMALAPLGERARSFLNWVITLGLVSTVFGRPTAILCLEIGKMLADHTSQSGWMWDTFIIVASFIAAVVAQVVLIIILHRRIDTITGQVKSQIRGSVEAVIKKPVTTSGQSFSQASASTNGEVRQVTKDVVVGGMLVKGAAVVANTAVPGSGAAAVGLHQMAKSRGRQHGDHNDLKTK